MLADDSPDIMFDRVLLGAMALFYAAILIGVYAFYVSPNFGYLGLDWYPLSFGSSLYIFAAVLFPVFLLPISFERPSDFLLWLVYLGTVVPAVTIPLVALRTASILLPNLSFLVLSFCIAVWLARIPQSWFVPRLRISPRIYWATIGLAGLVLFIIVMATFGINPQASLATAYDIRGEYKDKLESGGVIGYSMSLLANSLLPILMAGSLYFRRQGVVLALVAIQVLLFSATGNKSILFSSVLVVATFLLLTRKSPSARHILAGLILGLLLLVGVGEATGSPWPVSIGIRRLFIVPGYLTGAYMDYFETTQNILYSKSFLKEFAVYPEPIDYRYVIGSIYLRSPQMYANGNLWADGFANLGILGLPFVGVSFGIFLAVINQVVRLKNYRRMAFGTSAVSVAFFAISNSGFFTTLISHGLAVTVLLVILAPDEADNRVSQA